MTNLEFYRNDPEGLAKAIVNMCDNTSPNMCIHSCESCYSEFFTSEYVEKKKPSITVVANIAFTAEIPDYIIREGQAAIDKYAEKFRAACLKAAHSGVKECGWSEREGINVTDGAIQMFTFCDENVSADERVVADEVLSDN